MNGFLTVLNNSLCRLSGKNLISACVYAFMLFLLVGCGSGGSDSGSGSGSSTGLAGSQARFTIVGNHLYTVNKSNMQIFDITTASNPVPWSTQNIGFGIETIFANNNRLFIGSTTGIYIYDNTNPQFPQRAGSLLHARAIDPVVVSGNYAYVTLRSGITSTGGSNQLDIIDISSISQPVLVKSYAMQQPSGLGVDNGNVFVCDGIAGLKVLNVVDPNNIQLVDWVHSQNCYDVIPANNRLLVSGTDGLYQYNFASFPMVEVSRL